MQTGTNSLSDPIYGSLGPPSRDYKPYGEEALEMALRAMKPRSFEAETETVTDTENSIKIAEGIVKAKMAEPYDVKKRMEACYKSGKCVHDDVRYPVHDSDDEDEDTRATRASLRVAEKYYGQRFFVNQSDEDRYKQLEKAGKLRPEVKKFEETDDHLTLSKEDMDKKK